MSTTSLTLFENETFGSIRSLEIDGEPWFVAKDIASILEYSATEAMTRRLDDDEKGTTKCSTLGGAQDILIINESGLYSVILGSSKPEAKAFKKWITSEVLPSIRKIGSYSVNQQKQISHDYLSKEFKIAMEFVEMLGLDKNQAIFSANHSLKQFYNVDYLSNLNITHLISPTQQQFVTPTELGSQLNLSAKTINQKLESLGFQTSTRNHKNRLTWLVTDLGKQYAQLLDTNKKHSDGTPVMQIKWDHKIIEFIK